MYLDPNLQTKNNLININVLVDKLDDGASKKVEG